MFHAKFHSDENLERFKKELVDILVKKYEEMGKVKTSGELKEKKTSQDQESVQEKDNKDSSVEANEPDQNKIIYIPPPCDLINSVSFDPRYINDKGGLNLTRCYVQSLLTVRH